MVFLHPTPRQLAAAMAGASGSAPLPGSSPLVALSGGKGESPLFLVHAIGGTVSAYVVNDRVAWGQPRDQLRLSVFSANVVADAEDQDTATLEHSDLRRIPTLYPGERQLPTGVGEDPPAQPSIPGMEPDLPALTQQEQLEAHGQKRLLT